MEAGRTRLHAVLPPLSNSRSSSWCARAAPARRSQAGELLEPATARFRSLLNNEIA